MGDALQAIREDLALARRSLQDTLVVTLVARDLPIVSTTAGVLSEPARWAAAGHVLDFGDLHMESTANISVVCYPPGSPQVPPTADQLAAKLGDCLQFARLPGLDPVRWTSSGAAELLRTHPPAPDPAGAYGVLASR
jgi:hypothetical protein